VLGDGNDNTQMLQLFKRMPDNRLVTQVR